MFPVSDVIPPRTRPYVTLGLIAITVVVFLGETTLLRPDRQQLVETVGIVPGIFVWWTVVTGLFLHVGWLHVIGNAIYLWIFGETVEDRVGHVGFALLYLLCGGAAALVQMAAQPYSLTPIVGSSGAVAGVMGAYLILYPQSRILTAVVVPFFLDLIEVPAMFFVGVWLFLQLFSGLGSLHTGAAEGSRVFWGQMPGLAAGAFCGVLLRATTRRRRDWERYP